MVKAISTRQYDISSTAILPPTIPGYELPPPEAASPTVSQSGSVGSRRAPSFRNSTSSTVTAAAPLSGGNNGLSSSQTSSKNPGAHWPPEFYADFTSRVWITYRSHFYPIRDSSLTVLEHEQTEAAGAGVPTPISSRREWRRPPQPVYTADYATYVQILTWFFDSPSILCPFSVHRMALAGKGLGKGVEQWFGPSTAADAIKWSDLPNGCILGITLAHAITSSLQAIEMGRSCSGRTHRYLAWYRRHNPIYYETIKADNIFYLDPHHTPATIPLRPPTQLTTASERKRPKGDLCHLRAIIVPQRPPLPLSTSSSSSGGAHVRWNSAGANGGGSVLSGEASEAGLNPTQVHYVTSYTAAELRTFHSERVRKIPLSGLDPSMLIGFLCKTEADWIYLRHRVAELSKKHKAIFSLMNCRHGRPRAIVSNRCRIPRRTRTDMPEDNDKDSTRSGVGAGGDDGDEEAEVVPEVVPDGNGETHEDEGEDSSDDVGEGAVIHDRLSLRPASESGQIGSGGGTEDDPVGPVTPSAANTNTNTLPHNMKPTAVDFSRTISSDSTDLDDEEWVDPTPIPPTPLETAPPAFPPPIIAKTKSSSSAKSRKRKEARAHVPFPSSVQEDVQEDRPRRVPQMSTARGRDGGRTQSGGVKGVIAAG
ncbi:hypothetical protein V8E53_007456 [Lactarius tabidus]